MEVKKRLQVAPLGGQGELPRMPRWIRHPVGGAKPPVQGHEGREAALSSDFNAAAEQFAAENKCLGEEREAHSGRSAVGRGGHGFRAHTRNQPPHSTQPAPYF